MLRAAGQRIVMLRAHDMLDSGQHVALRPAAGAVNPNPVGVESQPHAFLRLLVGHGVDAAASGQRIAAVPAVEPVVLAAAGQAVVAARPHQLLDSRQRVALRVAAGARGPSDGKIHRHGRGGRGIGHPVKVPVAADQAVRARAAEHCIVARAAEQRVAARAARQRVAALAARQLVVALAARQRVVARAARQRVIARAARQRVVVPAARQLVVALAAEHCIVARAAAQRVAARAARQRVVAGPAVQAVRAPAARQRVVAGSAVERIAALIAGQGIAEGRADQVFNSHQRIAFGLAAAYLHARAQAHCDALAGSRVGCGIASRAADKRVLLRASLQRVVAGPAVDIVAAAAAAEQRKPVVARRSDQSVVEVEVLVRDRSARHMAEIKIRAIPSDPDAVDKSSARSRGLLRNSR